MRGRLTVLPAVGHERRLLCTFIFFSLVCLPEPFSEVPPSVKRILGEAGSCPLHFYFCIWARKATIIRGEGKPVRMQRNGWIAELPPVHRSIGSTGQEPASIELRLQTGVSHMSLNAALELHEQRKCWVNVAGIQQRGTGTEYRIFLWTSWEELHSQTQTPSWKLVCQCRRSQPVDSMMNRTVSQKRGNKKKQKKALFFGKTKPLAVKWLKLLNFLVFNGAFPISPSPASNFHSSPCWMCVQLKL